MYDDITRIPLIIRSPQGERRRSIRQSVISICWTATTMALADIETRDSAGGKYPCRNSHAA
ncbi:hypothetical protein ACLB1N_25105 [Escherichia coli]